MKKIGVTGSKGKIGSRLVKLGAIPYDFDLTSSEAVEAGLRDKPDVMIHAACVSSIKKCEEDYERAIAVNVWGTSKLCEQTGDGRVLFLSSEQVFDGVKGGYSEEDEPNPINNYGLTKLAAEGIVRQLYGGKVVRLGRGISRESGNDIDQYLEQLARGRSVEVPSFIWRNYSHLDYLAEAVWFIANNYESMPELLHIAGLQTVSFYELMCEIAEERGWNSRLISPRKIEIPDNKRPYRCGFDISLALAYGVNLYPLIESVEKLSREYVGL